MQLFGTIKIMHVFIHSFLHQLYYSTNAWHFELIQLIHKLVFVVKIVDVFLLLPLG